MCLLNVVCCCMVCLSVCVRGLGGGQCGCVYCLWIVVCCFMACYVRGVCVFVLRVVYCMMVYGYCFVCFLCACVVNVFV